MFCDKCGKEIPDSANFCRYCGNSIEADEIIGKSESTGFLEETISAEQTQFIDSAAGSKESVCDEAAVDKAASGAGIDDGKAVNSGDKSNEKYNNIRKKTLERIDYICIACFAALIFFVIGVIVIGKVNFTNQFKGTWSLMSGNYTCEDEENISSMPSYIEISGGGKASVDGYSGEYELDRDSETITLTAGPYCYSYDYIVEDSMLYLLSYGSEDGTGDAGIYLNYADATDEQQEYYDYAASVYSDIDLYEFLKGDWNEVNDGYEHFKMYDKDGSGTWINYSLAVPENDEEYYEIDGNLIKLGGEKINAFRVIPVSSDAAYFFCYADSSIYELQRSGE